MAMAPCSPIFALIPFVVLLSLSFFILVVLANVKTQALKVFGYIIVAICWLAALLLFSSVVHKHMQRMCPKMSMQRGMMEQSKEMPMPNGPGCPKMQSK